jgi:prophage regulatory protein
MANMAVRVTSLKPKIYFIKDVEEITRRNRITLRRWWEKDLFPSPVLINNRLAWHVDVIDQWIHENFGGSHD